MKINHVEEKNRLKKIEGQVRGLQKMIEEKRYCVDILIQFSSVRKALMKVEERILQRHLKGCVEAACKSGDKKVIEEKMSEVLLVLEKFRY